MSWCYYTYAGGPHVYLACLCAASIKYHNNSKDITFQLFVPKDFEPSNTLKDFSSKYGFELSNYDSSLDTANNIKGSVFNKYCMMKFANFPLIESQLYTWIDADIICLRPLIDDWVEDTHYCNCGWYGSVDTMYDVVKEGDKSRWIKQYDGLNNFLSCHISSADLHKFIYADNHPLINGGVLTWKDKIDFRRMLNFYFDDDMSRGLVTNDGFHDQKYLAYLQITQFNKDNGFGYMRRSYNELGSIKHDTQLKHYGWVDGKYKKFKAMIELFKNKVTSDSLLDSLSSEFIQLVNVI